MEISIEVNYMSSKDNDEESVMHSKIINIEMRINDKEDKVIEELFLSLLSRYQIELEILIKGRDFILDCVNIL